MRYALTIAYDGTAYAGWQCQKNATSIQEILEGTIEKVFQIRVRLTASGRTDAGVHALAQTCHFDAQLSIPAEKIPDALNKYLPGDIKVLEGRTVADDFDCNRSAKRKTYCYTLYVSRREMPLLDRYAVRIDDAPNLDSLQKVAKYFEGEHDFKAFCASGSSVKTTVRTIYEMRVEEEYIYGVRVLRLYVTGNGFLYNMVRTMTGEWLALANGKHDVSRLQSAFERGERTLLDKTMPAKGLLLMQVEYTEK